MNDNLGNRMKEYEEAFKGILPRRLPVILRVDGRSFHQLTRKMDKPYDHTFMAAMDAVAIALCEEVQGTQVAFVQSDEISLFIHGYKQLNSQSWFANEIQKMVSVSAAVATSAFNSFRPLGAQFDARVFVVPENDVCNYFIWRQNDCSRNSVQMVARSIFSQKACHGKKNSELQEMMFKEKGINWNDYPPRMKRGRCAIYVDAAEHHWVIDNNIPLFTQERGYIERFLEHE